MKLDYEVVQPLKIDAFSKTELALFKGEKVIIRGLDHGNAFQNSCARLLANRERFILNKLSELKSPYFPRLIYYDKKILIRSYFEGTPLKTAGKQSADFYKKALEIVHGMHKIGVIHNDLEKAENWIVKDDGNPGIIDFQISIQMSFRKNYFFKWMSFEDIRHTLKNKKRHCQETLSEEELIILNKKSVLNKVWKYIYKPTYHFITRKIFNYSDAKGSKYSR